MAALAIGDTIDGRFELESILGEGGFGVVYQARQISTGQTVAIKLLQPDKLINAKSADVETARFEREMQLIGSLKHPNIVRLIDSGHLDDGQLFTVLEYIDGDPLSVVIDKGGPMHPRDVHRLMVHVLEALSSAHSQGIIHRDLKPQNIMVTNSGSRPSALVLDFGIAAVAEGARNTDYRSLTATGQFHGTPSYMAPEQLRERHLSPAIDIYAWGLVYLECLTGRPVVVADSFAGIIYQQMAPDPIPISRQILAHPVGEIIRKAVAKNSGNRWANVDEVLHALDSIDATIDLPDPAVVTGEFNRDFPDTGEGPDASDRTESLDFEADTGQLPRGELEVTGEGERPDAPPRTNRGMLAAVIGLSLALIAAVGWIVVFQPGAEEKGAEAGTPTAQEVAPTGAKKLPDSPADTPAEPPPQIANDSIPLDNLDPGLGNAAISDDTVPGQTVLQSIGAADDSNAIGEQAQQVLGETPQGFTVADQQESAPNDAPALFQTKAAPKAVTASNKEEDSKRKTKNRKKKAAAKLVDAELGPVIKGAVESAEDQAANVAAQSFNEEESNNPDIDQAVGGDASPEFSRDGQQAATNEESSGNFEEVAQQAAPKKAKKKRKKKGSTSKQTKLPTGKK